MATWQPNSLNRGACKELMSTQSWPSDLRNTIAVGLHKKLTFFLQMFAPCVLILLGHDLNGLDGRGGYVGTIRDPYKTLHNTAIDVTEITEVTVTWR